MFDTTSTNDLLEKLLEYDRMLKSSEYTELEKIYILDNASLVQKELDERLEQLHLRR